MASKCDLSSFIRQCRHKKRKLLAIYLTCGFPNREWTVPLAQSIFDAGADIIELGMPFSDPLADGPVIQAASQTALENGITLDNYFAIAAEISTLGPTLFMGYLNSVIAIPRFLDCAQQANLCGLIIPDWPVAGESFSRLEIFAAHQNLPRIPFIAPTTTPERLQAVDDLDAPFVYAVAVTGVTGSRAGVGAQASDYLKSVKRSLKSPLLAGFGISSPRDAAQIAEITDGVIIGSAILEGIRAANSVDEAQEFVHQFITRIRHELDKTKHL